MSADGTLLFKRESHFNLLVVAYSARRVFMMDRCCRSPAQKTTVSFGCRHAMPPGYSCPAAFSMKNQPTVVNHACLASSSDRLATVTSLSSSGWVDRRLRIRASPDLPGGARGWAKSGCKRTWYSSNPAARLFACLHPLLHAAGSSIIDDDVPRVE